MDEVPIANSNPVTSLIKGETKKEKVKPNRLVETLKNFFLMMPLALIISIQLYYLGKSFGTFSTFPFASFSTYIFLAAIGILFLFLQMLMRSITYSSLIAVFFVSGIFTAWFGDFYTPMIENFQSFSSILKAAWSRKDVPYPLLMSGITSGIFFLSIVIQFFFSLLTKSFFEAFFGREWGDGKWAGFLGAIALILGVQLGFHFYSNASERTAEKVYWKVYQTYSPMEKYLALTPSATIYSKKMVSISNDKFTKVIDFKTGTIKKKRSEGQSFIQYGWQDSEVPILSNNTGLKGYASDLGAKLWEVNFPSVFPDLEIPEDKKSSFSNIPLKIEYLKKGDQFLVFYDYGYVALHDLKTGKEIWLKSIDVKIRANRLFPETYLESSLFAENESSLFFSCYNGRVKCISKETGDQTWIYEHDTPKHNGKGQRAFLEYRNEKLLVSFMTGQMKILSANDGRQIFQAVNKDFTMVSKPFWGERTISFINDDGKYYNVEQDGGKVIFSETVIPNRINIIPMVSDLEKGIVAYRENVFKIDPEQKEVKSIFESKNRIFSTTPVFDEKLMYIGTMDGWVHCLHIGSIHEKWRVHVAGELSTNALKLTETGLLVKTKSGSLYNLNKAP